MRQLRTTLTLAALTAGLALLTGTGAEAFSPKVRKACAGDYQNFCAQYVPESNEVRRCFESNRKGLSQICVSALVDAGEVPAKYLKK